MPSTGRPDGRVTGTCLRQAGLMGGNVPSTGRPDGWVTGTGLRQAGLMGGNVPSTGRPDGRVTGIVAVELAAPHPTEGSTGVQPFLRRACKV
eukprot:365234-Chlamydomonas_euryale.AAC.5